MERGFKNYIIINDGEKGMKQQLAYYLITLLLISSCTLAEYPGETLYGDPVDITFTLDIPEATEVVSRAYDDNSIRNIDLLVFNSSDQFIQRVKVDAISGTGTTKTFSVRLPSSTTARTIHVIANARGDNNNDVISFAHIATNAPESTAIPGLISPVLAAGNAPVLPIPMWGRTTLPAVASSTSIAAPINMLRMVASMYVNCDAPTSANGLDDFTLTSFSLANTADRGKVAPATITTGASTPATPSLPGTLSNIHYPVSATSLWATAANNTTSELYLYEKNNTGAATDVKIIIKGTWKGTEGYYPVWMKDATNTRYNVVRNHRYKVTIKGVYGTCYSTYTEAIAAEPSTSNIGVTITDSNADITDVITDGKYTLGLGSNVVTVSGGGEKTLTKVMKTNTGATLVGTTDVSWITGINFAVSGNRWDLKANFASTSSQRTGNITVRAGNLTRTIKITQNP